VNPLRVRGNRIVDAIAGEPVMLRGINRSGLEYSPAALPESDFEAMIVEWGANIIRLPFNQEWALTSEAYLELIDTAVAMASIRGAYVLLDLQWLDAHTIRGYDHQNRANFVPALPDSGSIDVWRKLAARYRDNPTVLYDIFNEPHDPLPGDDPMLPARITACEWTPWAAALANAIRSEHPEAVIFVPGTNWAYDLSAYPIPEFEDVVYSTHIYANKGADWDRAFGNLSSVAPVFAGEWGADDVEWGRTLAAYLEQHGIGWTAWSWVDEPRITIAGAPTDYGSLVRDLLRTQQNS
jgi:endoglucanase